MDRGQRGHSSQVTWHLAVVFGLQFLFQVKWGSLQGFEQRRNTRRQRFLRKDTKRSNHKRHNWSIGFYLLIRNTIQELKIQATGRKKISAICMPDRGLVPEYKNPTHQLFIYLFWPRCAACGISVPGPGTEPGPWQ